MNNRYGSIMERITAKQEAEDREDGDAIRREYAVEQREKRASDMWRNMKDEEKAAYYNQFLDEQELGEYFYGEWITTTLNDEYPED